MIPSNLLRHSCNIQQRTASGRGTTGQQEYTWASVQTGAKCRLDEGSGRQIKLPAGNFVQATHTLFINKGSVTVSINEKEFRIEVGGQYYSILLVVDAGGAGHHYEFALERVY